MTPDQKKKVRNTLITAAIFLVLLAQPHAGFMIIFFTLPLAIWISYCLFVAFAKPELRRTHVARVSIWLLAVTLVVTIHYCRHLIIRNDANQVVAEIKAFQAKNGRYPVTLDEIGISRAEMTKRLGYSYYSAEHPHVMYAATFIVYDKYIFDFEKDAWAYHPD